MATSTGRWVHPGEPTYPAGFRLGSSLTVTVDVTHDGAGRREAERLAEDMALVVRRALEDRGCDVWEWSSGAKTRPLWLEDTCDHGRAGAGEPSSEASS